MAISFSDSDNGVYRPDTWGVKLSLDTNGISALGIPSGADRAIVKKLLDDGSYTNAAYTTSWGVTEAEFLTWLNGTPTASQAVTLTTGLIRGTGDPFILSEGDLRDIRTQVALGNFTLPRLATFYRVTETDIQAALDALDPRPWPVIPDLSAIWGIDTAGNPEFKPEPVASFFEIHAEYDDRSITRLTADSWPETILMAETAFGPHAAPDIVSMLAADGHALGSRKAGWPLPRDKWAFDLDNGYVEYAKGEFDEVAQTWTAHRVYLKLKD
jgi:hypothetical protein